MNYMSLSNSAIGNHKRLIQKKKITPVSVLVCPRYQPAL